MSRACPDLVVILDGAPIRNRPAADWISDFASAGVSAVQFRAAGIPRKDKWNRSRPMRGAASRAGIRFFVNDDADLALALSADGVHVGQTDLPVACVRKAVGPGLMIGVSARTPDEALRAEREGADYLGAGAVFPTSSKLGAPAIGTNGLAAVRAAVRIPVLAIGGITPETALQALDAGADGVAVISAIVAAPDPLAAVASLVRAVRKAALPPLEKGD